MDGCRIYTDNICRLSLMGDGPLSVISQNGYDRFDSNILKIPASTVSSNLRANKP